MTPPQASATGAFNRDLMGVSELLSQLRNLPPLSTGVAQLLGLSVNDPALLEKAKQIIEADPALATQVLKVANSAAFSGQAIVDSIERAILRIGVRMIVGTIAQTQLQKVFEPIEGIMAALWLANVYSANLAMLLAQQNPELGVSPETAYTYGLLHDVGRLVMVPVLGPRLQPIIDEMPHIRTELAMRERAEFGYDHTTVGRLLGNRWKLPADITLTLTAHHMPPAERGAFPAHVNKLIDLLAVVDEIVHVIACRAEKREDVEGALTHQLDGAEGKALLAPTGLTREKVLPALAPAFEAVEKQRSVLGLRTPLPFARKPATPAAR